MKLISVIGTRPQYIKLKPFYDFCKANNINHIVLDTLQHYSDNVSTDLIRDLGLEIDISLQVRKVRRTTTPSSIKKPFSEHINP